MVAGTSSTLWRTKCGHSADKFLPGEKCTLDKRVWWSSFTLEIHLMQTRMNPFFTGPQDISAMKVAEILPFALLQELLGWSEKKVWSTSLLGVSQLGLPSDGWSLINVSANIPMLLIAAASCWIAYNTWYKNQSSLMKVELHKLKLPKSVQNYHAQYPTQLTLRSICYSS